MPLHLVSDKPSPSPPSRSSSYSSYHSAPSPERSLLDLFSTQPKGYEHEELPRYLDEDRHSIHDHKALPSLPSDSGKEGKGKLQERYDLDHPALHPFFPSSSSHHASVSSSSLISTSQLAGVLGPENVPQTTEIDTLPCAGIKISVGPLTGLLAWRLVVRLPPPEQGRRGWWNDTPAAAKRTRRLSAASLQPPPPLYTRTSTEAPLTAYYHSTASLSALSLPSYKPHSTSLMEKHSSLAMPHPQIPKLSRKSHIHVQKKPSLAAPATAVVANFLLDTSLPYSIISRETLRALGYPAQSLEPSGLNPSDAPAVVTLIIQNVPTRLRIARPGEASRLGVQFLQDKDISLGFPKNSGGPVLYVESDITLQNAPRTVAGSSPTGAKLTLPQRVRALFGLS